MTLLVTEHTADLATTEWQQWGTAISIDPITVTTMCESCNRTHADLIVTFADTDAIAICLTCAPT